MTDPLLYLRIRVSGPDPARHAPLQLGALRTDPEGGPPAVRLWRLQLPEVYDVPDDEWLPGLLGSPEDPCSVAYVGARPERTALEEFFRFAEGCAYLVGHHLPRERSFLEAMARRQGLSLPPWFWREGLWVLHEAQWAQDDGFLPAVPNLGLEALRSALLPPLEESSTAATDVQDLVALRARFDGYARDARREASVRASASAWEEARQRALEAGPVVQAMDPVMLAAMKSGKIGAGMTLGTWTPAPPPRPVSPEFLAGLKAWADEFLPGRKRAVDPAEAATPVVAQDAAPAADDAKELDDAFFR